MDTSTSNSVTNDSTQTANQIAQVAATIALNSAAAGYTAPGTAGNPIVTTSGDAKATNYTPLLVGAIIVYFIFKKGIL